MKWFGWRRQSAVSVGVIKGGDGPTAVFFKKGRKTDQAREQWEAFLSRAAREIQPCGHPFSEIGRYLEERWGAIPVNSPNHQMEMLKVNVILNHHREELNLPDPPREGISRRKLIKYAREDTSLEQALRYPAEKLGLQTAAYRVPGGEEGALVLLEYQSGYYCIQNGWEELADDLLFWLGVTREDIENRSPRFIAYAHRIKQLGKLS